MGLGCCGAVSGSVHHPHPSIIAGPVGPITGHDGVEPACFRRCPLREVGAGSTLPGRLLSRPPTMPVRKPSPDSTHAAFPRPALAEIAGLLTTALLRLHADAMARGGAQASEISGSRLGFAGQQRVNANPSCREGLPR